MAHLGQSRSLGGVSRWLRPHTTGPRRPLSPVSGSDFGSVTVVEMSLFISEIKALTPALAVTTSLSVRGSSERAFSMSPPLSSNFGQKPGDCGLRFRRGRSRWGAEPVKDLRRESRLRRSPLAHLGRSRPSNWRSSRSSTSWSLATCSRHTSSAIGPGAHRRLHSHPTLTYDCRMNRAEVHAPSSASLGHA
jgi:hypothetical protein